MTATAPHVCHEGGWLVSSDGWLGAHPSDFDWYANYARVGCSALVCGRCGERVEQRAGWRLIGYLTPPDPGLLFGQPHWGGIPALTADDDGRTYVCRCAVTSVLGPRSILTPDERAPELPWRCAGHPPLLLRAVLDGVQVAAEPTALFALAADALARRIPAVVPWPASAEGHPAMWWARLYAMLPADVATGVAQRTAMGEGAAAALDAADPVVRRGALEFFWLLPTAPGSERLADLVRNAIHLYDGVQIEPERDLGYYLRRALNARIELDGAWGGPEDLGACGAAAHDLRYGRGAVSFVFALGRRDPAWLAQHGPAIASHNPTLLLAILHVFAGAPLPILADVAQRLTAEPRIATDQLLDAAKAVGGAAQPVLETVIRAGRGSP